MDVTRPLLTLAEGLTLVFGLLTGVLAVISLAIGSPLITLTLTAVSAASTAVTFALAQALTQRVRTSR